LNVKHVTCCSSGTTALEIALKSLNVGFLDYVIVPNITFIGTAMAVLKVGALPIFADVDITTSCLSLDSIKHLYSIYKNKIKALIMVHLGGQCCDIDGIVDWAKENQISTIEDCAQSVGTFYKNKHVGSFADIGCFSFQNSKNLTSGEGGAIVTNKNYLATKINKYVDFNHDPLTHNNTFKYLAGNSRLTEFQGAILLAQIPDFNRLNMLREQKLKILASKLSAVKGIVCLNSPQWLTKHGCHLFMFRYQKEHFSNKSKNALIKFLQNNNIPCFGGYNEIPLDQFSYFKEKLFLKYDPFWKSVSKITKYDFPIQYECNNSYILADELIWIPQIVLLQDQKYIETIPELLEHFRGDNIKVNVSSKTNVVSCMNKNYYPLNLSEYFTNDGISYDHLKSDGSFNGLGANYPAEELPKSNTIIEVDAIPFYFPSKENGFKNNLVLRNQTFIVPRNYYKSIFVLGATEGLNGETFEEKMSIKCSDKTSQELTIGLSNWLLYPVYNERIAFMCTHLHYPDNGQITNRNIFSEAIFIDYQKDSDHYAYSSAIYNRKDFEDLSSSDWKPKIWLQQLQLPIDKKIDGFCFETENLNFHIFAITFELYTNNE
jgi:dTDP-4-amino-4,6-dideoxygalactose transaminase